MGKCLYDREGHMIGCTMDSFNTVCINNKLYYGGKKELPDDPLDQKYEFAQKQINSLLGVKRVVFNDPATIIFWADGEKTVVKCSEGETFNPYMGFCAAVAKRVYGNNSRVRKIVDGGYYQDQDKEVHVKVSTNAKGSTYIGTDDLKKTKKGKKKNNG